MEVSPQLQASVERKQNRYPPDRVLGGSCSRLEMLVNRKIPAADGSRSSVDLPTPFSVHTQLSLPISLPVYYQIKLKH
jgi:hypothetical protein